MKYFFWCIFLLLFLLLSLYSFLTTEFGHNKLKESLQTQIERLFKINTAITFLEITHKHFETKIVFDEKSTLNIEGVYSLLERKVDFTYDVNLSHGAYVEKILHHKMNGSLYAHGTIKGKYDNLNIEGYSDVADGETNYSVKIIDGNDITLILKSQEIILEELFHTFGFIPYANAEVAVELNLHTIIDKKIESGRVKIDAKQGKVNTTVLQREFEYFFPRTIFNTTIETKIDTNIFTNKIVLHSSLFDMKSENLEVSRENFGFKGDYNISIEDLHKFYFLTHRELQGAIEFDGYILKERDLDVTFHSEIAQGKLNAKLHNEQLTAEFARLNSLDILKIIRYPEIFDSVVSGGLEYDFLKESGSMQVQLDKGTFISNEPFDMIKKYTQRDLYKEKFQGGLHTNIQNEHLVGSLNLVSNNAKLSTKSAYLDAQKKFIDSKVEIVVKEYPVDFNIRGDVHSPNVSVDLKKFMNSKTGDMVQKELLRLLQNLF